MVPSSEIVPRYLKIKINITDSSIELVFAYGPSSPKSSDHNEFTLTVTLSRKFCVKDTLNDPPAPASVPHVQSLCCCKTIPYIIRYHFHMFHLMLFKFIYHMSQKANQIPMN